jgi:hypothetical protein
MTSKAILTKALKIGLLGISVVQDVVYRNLLILLLVTTSCFLACKEPFEVVLDID